MKKAALLFLAGALCVCACDKESTPETYQDAELTGKTVDVSALSSKIKKVFVLNEGGMGSNNATLDFLRVSDGTYITGAFKKMNPEAGAGLGDVGNDIAVHGNEIWIVVNNSGIVEVLSAKDETEIAAIKVATPRNIAFDDKYAYVTSWAGAYAAYDSDWNLSVEDSKNPKGQVYRIDLKTKKVEGNVEVGYQPEGIACHDGKLYVANSGGISSQLPPDYAYDNTVSVIDTKTFKVEKSIEVQINLKNVYSDGKGNIFVTTLGNYYNIHSGLYMIDAAGAVKPVSDYVSVSTLRDGTVYWIGTDSEFDWSGTPHVYKAWSFKDGALNEISLPVEATALYGLYALDDDVFLVSDAIDYYNPGTVSLYVKGAKVWTQTAGVCPGHFAIW